MDHLDSPEHNIKSTPIIYTSNKFASNSILCKLNTTFVLFIKYISSKRRLVKIFTKKSNVAVKKKKNVETSLILRSLSLYYM